MCQQRVQNTKISMSQCRRLLRQVEEVADQDIHQNVQIIGEEIFISAWGGKDQIKQLQGKQL